MGWLCRVRGNEGAIYQCRTRGMAEFDDVALWYTWRWVISASSVGVVALWHWDRFWIDLINHGCITAYVSVANAGSEL